MDEKMWSPEQLCEFIKSFDPFQRGDVFEVTRSNIEQLYWSMEVNK